MVGGVRCYESRVKRCAKEGRRLYRTATQSIKSRVRKKLLGNKDWYKKRKRHEEDDNTTQRSKKMKREATTTEIPTSSVMFVSFTPEGELGKRLREVMQMIEKTLGFRVRIVEKCGTPLRLLFSPTKLWEGVKCGREDCTT